MKALLKWRATPSRRTAAVLERIDLWGRRGHGSEPNLKHTIRPHFLQQAGTLLLVPLPSYYQSRARQHTEEMG